MPTQKKIYTANGVDGKLMIFDKADAITNKLPDALGTRPGARAMEIDPALKKLFLVTAEGAQDQSKKINRGPGYFYPNRFFPDTFVLLTYSRK